MGGPTGGGHRKISRGSLVVTSYVRSVALWAAPLVGATVKSPEDPLA